MAAGSGVGNLALEEILKATLDLDTDSLHIMLVDDDYVFDASKDVVDLEDDSVNDAHHHEAVATNYTGGFEGAGRKAATVAVAHNDTDDRGEVTVGDLTWSSLGNGSNDTVGAALLIKHGTSDTDSRVIACWDLVDTLTDGDDFVLNFAATGGNIRIG